LKQEISINYSHFPERFYTGADWLLWQCGNCREAFFENARLFFTNACHFKDMFREFEAFLKILILFEDIFREIEAYYKHL
jgi:hypothetical protein